MILNMIVGGAGGSGGVLTVSAPAGVAVNVSKDDKSYTKTSSADGTAVFKGLTSGVWTVTISNDSQEASQIVTIDNDYEVVIAFFAATISVTYPSGSVCTCTDGAITLTAPNTTGSHSFIVPNTGIWTIHCTNGTETTSTSVSITYSGQTQKVTLAYFAATISITYPAGSTCTCSDGTTTLTAPDTSGFWECVVSNTGTWTVSCTDGTNTKSTTVEITTDGQSENITLAYWNGELYDAGNEYESVTGGWYAGSYLSGYTEGDGANVTKFDDYMSVGIVSGGTTSAITTNAIDFSGFTTLYVTYANVSGGKYSAVRIAEDFPNTTFIATAVCAGTSGTVEIPLSGITVPARIAIGYSVDVYKVWME